MHLNLKLNGVVELMRIYKLTRHTKQKVAPPYYHTTTKCNALHIKWKTLTSVLLYTFPYNVVHIVASKIYPSISCRRVTFFKTLSPFFFCAVQNMYSLKQKTEKLLKHYTTCYSRVSVCLYRTTDIYRELLSLYYEGIKCV